MVPSTEWDSVMSLNFTYDYQIIDSLGNTVSIGIGSGTPAVKGAGNNLLATGNSEAFGL